MCPSRKFPTKEEALAAEKEARLQSTEHARQHPYACNECAAWHLSTTAPKSTYLHKREEVLALKLLGLSVQEIATRTNVPHSSVYYYCKTAKIIHKPAKPIAPSSIISVESLSQEEQIADANLQAIRRKLNAVTEAKKLKVEVHNRNTILVKKEGNVIPLSFADAFELAEKLIDLTPYQ